MLIYGSCLITTVVRGPINCEHQLILNILILIRTRGTSLALTPTMRIESHKQNSNNDIYSYFYETTIWCIIVFLFPCFSLYTYIILSCPVNHTGPKEIWLFISTDAVQCMMCPKGCYIVIKGHIPCSVLNHLYLELFENIKFNSYKSVEIAI